MVSDVAHRIGFGLGVAVCHSLSPPEAAYQLAPMQSTDGHVARSDGREPTLLSRDLMRHALLCTCPANLSDPHTNNNTPGPW